MINATDTHDTNLSVTASICIAMITAIPIFVNIVYVIVCFKTLRRKFHNLLVLTLCICDCFLGLSLTWFVIASLIDSLRTNIRSCLFQTFAVSYGLMSTYSIILVICLERYAVVKAMNFGIMKTLDRFKYLAIGGTLALVFMYTIETVLFTRAVERLDACSIPNVYGEQYSFFIQVMVGGISFILILIIVVTTMTSYQIWYLFYRKKNVHPSDINHSTNFRPHKTSEMTSEQLVRDSVTADSLTISRDSTRKEKNNTNLSETISIALETMTQSMTAHASGLDARSNTHIETEMNVSELKENEVQQKSSNTKVQQLITHMKSERLYNDPNHLNVHGHRILATQAKTFKFAAWEFRAFATSIIISITTLICTGPVLISYWMDVFTERLLPQQSRFVLLVPLVINSIINPFIYAWRIPEIRKELKRVFCRLCN